MTTRLLFLPLVLVTIFSLGGCATAAKPQMMVVQPVTSVPANPALVGLISVAAVTGGKSTNPMWSSQVDNAGFKQALEKSLRIAGYLAAPGNNSHELTAHLVDLKQPLIGASMKVTATVNYQLVGPDGSIEMPVVATGTAGAFEKLLGVARLQLANERAISENIKALLADLANYSNQSSVN